jgi:addiction module HigA family antidote
MASNVELVDYHQEYHMDALPPVSPGELLQEEFLIPMRISKYRLAKDIGVPAQRIGEIVAGRRSITADTDVRFCRYFGLSNGYWLRAQAAYGPSSPPVDSPVTAAAAEDLFLVEAMVRCRSSSTSKEFSVHTV